MITVDPRYRDRGFSVYRASQNLAAQSALPMTGYCRRKGLREKLSIPSKYIEMPVMKKGGELFTCLMYIFKLQFQTSPPCKRNKFALYVCILVLCVYNLQMAAKYMKPLTIKINRFDGLLERRLKIRDVVVVSYSRDRTSGCLVLTRP